MADAAIFVWLFGWLAVWPAARWLLRRSANECAILRWVFISAIVLESAALGYVWHVYASGNRDAFMAWLLPQSIASLAWLGSLVALAVLMLGSTSKAHRYP